MTLKDTLEKHRREIVYDIKRNISVGLMNGDRMSTVAKRISDSVDHDYRKAMTITRTETQRVREAGHLDAAKDLDEHLRKAGFCQAKIWRTKQDERVRPGRGIGKKKSRNGANHVRMQGVTLPVNEYFDLGRGVKTLAPGQSGDAKNDINCRCRLSYRTVPIDKVEKTDILKENKIKPIPITDDAIEKVPIVKSALLSDEQNEVLREKHRELLRFVQNEKPGIEAIAYLDRNLDLLGRKTGGYGYVKGNEMLDAYIVTHNHPSGESFSYKDIFSFVIRGNTSIFTVAGNNGKCYLVEKLSNYDASSFVHLLKDAELKYPHYKDEYGEHQKFMDYVMKGALKYGVRFN